MCACARARSCCPRSIPTNLLELLLRTVLAFPKASRSGLDCKMMSLTRCIPPGYHGNDREDSTVRTNVIHEADCLSVLSRSEENRV